jgi:AraC family transcriptional regulator
LTGALKRICPAIEFARLHPDGDLSLRSLAARTRLSAFHMHRVFSAAAGETPKQFIQRLRLDRSAAMLLTGDDSVLQVALACGFHSHESFSRAFRRRFRMTPSAYRERGFVNNPDAVQAREHAGFVDRVGPCVGLYYTTEKSRYQRKNMTYSITKTTLSPQPVLVVRRTVNRSEIAATIADVLPRVFMYAQRHGLALTGQPFARYIEIGPGLVTIEPGMRVTKAANAPGGGEVVLDTLPGGEAATTVHMGQYENLPDAYAAIERWMKANGAASGGAPWECYITDPADHPDPKDWRTEIFWPLA